MRFSFLSLLVPSLLAVAQAQTPFPIAFKSVAPEVEYSITSIVAPIVTSLAAEPAFTSWATYMNTATGLTDDENNAFDAAHGNPLELADLFFIATATPAWYTQIPSDLQSYVSAFANAENSVALQIAGEAGRLDARIAAMGALLGAGVVAVLLL